MWQSWCYSTPETHGFATFRWVAARVLQYGNVLSRYQLLSRFSTHWLTRYAIPNLQLVDADTARLYSGTNTPNHPPNLAPQYTKTTLSYLLPTLRHCASSSVDSHKWRAFLHPGPCHWDVCAETSTAYWRISHQWHYPIITPPHSSIFNSEVWSESWHLIDSSK